MRVYQYPSPKQKYAIVGQLPLTSNITTGIQYLYKHRYYNINKYLRELLNSRLKKYGIQKIKLHYLRHNIHIFNIKNHQTTILQFINSTPIIINEMSALCQKIIKKLTAIKNYIAPKFLIKENDGSPAKK